MKMQINLKHGKNIITAIKALRSISSLSYVFLLTCILILQSFGDGEQLWAQEKQKSEATTTEDNSFRQQRNYLLNLMVYSDDPIEKRLAVQRLGQLIEQGKLKQNDTQAVNTLMRLAQQGTAQKSYDGDHNLVNNNFPVRADACNLLSKLGGPLAEAGLVSIMTSDIEPVIAAVTFESILKVDPEGSPVLIEKMVNTFYKYHYTNRDNTLAYSFLYVVAQYAANSKGKLLSPNLMEAVHDLSLPSNVYMRSVRTEARSLILRWLGADYPTLKDLN